MRGLEIRIWNEKQFRPPHATLEELLRLTQQFDYAAFIFGADDELSIDSITKELRYVTRDNVIFELGLFTSALGPKRVFIVPEDVEEGKLEVLSDLAGITRTAGCRQPSDGVYMSEMQSAAQDIASAVRGLGSRPGAPHSLAPAYALSVGLWVPSTVDSEAMFRLPGSVLSVPEATVMVTYDVGKPGEGLRRQENRYLWAISKQTPALRQGFGLYHASHEDGSSSWWLDACCGEEGNVLWAKPAPNIPDDIDTIEPGVHHFAVTWSYQGAATALWIDGGTKGHSEGELVQGLLQVEPRMMGSELTIGFFPSGVDIHSAGDSFRDFVIFHRVLADEEIQDWAHMSTRR